MLRKKGNLGVLASGAMTRTRWPCVPSVIQFVKADRYELYDLAADPGERTDLATQRPNDVARLKVLLATARTPSGAFPLLN